MNPLVCLYFQVHQPYRLRDLRITEIGSEGLAYFDTERNRAIFRKIADKCYLPANALLLDLLRNYPDFSVAYSISGVFLEQCEEYGTDVLDSFKALAATGKVEFLAETYYHSLSSVKSVGEFAEQVRLHVDAMERTFGQRPSVFRNTELIYSNELAQMARMMGFSGILAEGADHVLDGRNPNDPFRPPAFRLPAPIERAIRAARPLPLRARDITILLKNYKLSDDVAFRFSDKSWVQFPLSAKTFTDWIAGSAGHCVNLFMDYETFGEHQWADTGIFDFLRRLPELWQERGIRAVTPSLAIREWKAEVTPVFDAHTCISWADIERDLSAWLGNRIQNAAADGLYALESDVKRSGNPELLRLWRLLQTSDHFYYMCTKYWADGDVHKYFSPYESPYEAYRRFSHALHDLRQRLESCSHPKGSGPLQPVFPPKRS